jgi:signal peptidase II
MKEKFLKGLKWFFNSFIWLGVLLLIIDYVTKQVVVANRENILANGGIVLIPNFLRINYVINNTLVMGMSLGSDLANRAVFCVVALVISAGIIFYLIKKWDKIDRFFKASFMMILAGAFGNVIDRLFYTPEFLGNPVNGVVDWIDFYGVWKFNFNIADSAVVVAAFMLIIYMIVLEIIEYRKKSKEAPKEKKEDNTKVLSKTEREKQQYLENKDE